MNIKSVCLVLGSILCMLSCKNESSGKKFEVNGTLTNSDAKKVYLEEVPIGTMQRVVVDSADVKDGKFTLKTKSKESSIYGIRLDQQEAPVASVINDASSVTVNVTVGKVPNGFVDNYEVKGSEASQQMKDFIKQFTTATNELMLLAMRADSLRQSTAPDSVVGPVSQALEQKAASMRQMFNTTIANSKDPALTIFALGYYQQTANDPRIGLPGLSLDEVTGIINETAAKNPDHVRLAGFKSQLDASIAMQKQAESATLWMGKSAPELSLPDANGKQVSLSSYKGKYVLVDFWASWCKPCRIENPVVVNAYNKFKDKNFAILGVSLDEKKDNWLKAVKDDRLSWTHVSDLKGWGSEAVEIYGFGALGIPYNVLVDPNGKVIAERLRGAELEAKLAALLK